MKVVFFIVAIWIAAPLLEAQTTAPIRLAVIAETDAASDVADLLTAQLSGGGKVQLLERNEIQRVYREQALSATGRDDLKLGRILGANGLLILNVVNKAQISARGLPTPTVVDLTMRLIAVKPGVVLASKSFALQQSELADWSASFAPHLDVLLPKLIVLEKDAIPISIVNLRSALQSDEGKTTERQLKLLTIQRLSEEPRLFVLERQRMELLAEEKDLKRDESPFWNGSYLLEGVLDQNGFVKETITLNARLTPPKGGVPLAFEIRGARTNLAALVNELAKKVNESLKIQTAVKSWNADDEARQYLDEANWALRWEVYGEAQMAAESAWALGKRDLECALVRTKSYVLAVPGVAEPGVTHFAHWKKLAEVHLNERPDPQECATALYALQCYDEFCRTSPDGQARGKGWSDDWYHVGIDALNAASAILQHFNLFPDAQKPVADQLADMRGRARSVAELISKWPSVHDSYFVGNKVVTHDVLGSMDDQPNLFRCETEWGCYWQEKPEETIALYRQLMSSPVFAYVHQYLWMRPFGRPRLVAWNDDDRQAIPAIWEKFTDELKNSPDVSLQLEAGAFAVADAKTEQKMAVAFTNFFDSLISHRETLVTNHVEVLYLDWRAGALVPGSGVVTPVKEALQHLYWSEYRPKLEAMDEEYWRNTQTGGLFKTDPKNADNLEQFEKQKRYLKENTPFDPHAFVRLFLFGYKDYSKAQALEILPLFDAYKTNLDAEVKENKPFARIGLMQLGHAEDGVNRILHPPPTPAPKPAPLAALAPPVSAPAAVVAPARISIVPKEIITNVLTVDTFLPIPIKGLTTNSLNGVTIAAHHWVEGKLVLDLSYQAEIFKFDAHTNWQETRVANYSGVAILDPKTRQWLVAPGPEENIMERNHFYHRTTLWRGGLFTSDASHIKKYDFQTKAWQNLDVSDGGGYELFSIAGHLYAANESTVFEITEDGKRTRLLASTRRQPPLSVLDSEELGTPALFEGPDHSLRLATPHKIFTWTGADWRGEIDLPYGAGPIEIFPDGISFLTGYSLVRLTTESATLESCLEQNARLPNVRYNSPPPADSLHGAPPKWKLPSRINLARLARAWRQRDMFLLANHSDTRKIVDEKRHVITGDEVVTRDGSHTELLCFSDGSPLPQELYLRFDATDRRPPVAGSWMVFADDDLIFGSETAEALMGFSGMGRAVKDPGIGVWLMPFSHLAPAIVEQKQAQLAQAKRAAATARESRQGLLAKYDRNHNGIIDADEREEALDDPVFIESQLDMIDTNHNHWLDVDELAYFDANKNKVLEPKEEAGIDIAQHFLAERLLKQFDANGDGLLDSKEFNLLMQDHQNNAFQPPGGSWFPSADVNHDGFVDSDELAAFLKARLGVALRPHQFGPGFAPPVGGQQTFKTLTEEYWQHPGGVASRPRFPGQPPFGPGRGPFRSPTTPTPQSNP